MSYTSLLYQHRHVDSYALVISSKYSRAADRAMYLISGCFWEYLLNHTTTSNVALILRCGNNTVVMCPEVGLDKLVPMPAISAFPNAGQTCVATK